jgi:hypothetical protein
MLRPEVTEHGRPEVLLVDERRRPAARGGIADELVVADGDQHDHAARPGPGDPAGGLVAIDVGQPDSPSGSRSGASRSARDHGLLARAARRPPPRSRRRGDQGRRRLPERRMVVDREDPDRAHVPPRLGIATDGRPPLERKLLRACRRLANGVHQHDEWRPHLRGRRVSGRAPPRTSGRR